MTTNCPKSCPGSTSLPGFAREIAAWLGYVDPKHEAVKLIQITKGTLKARRGLLVVTLQTTSTWDWMDCELAVALAIVTEGAAGSTVLKLTQVEPSHWFAAWQAPVDGYVPKSSKDPSYIALQPKLAILPEVQGRKGHYLLLTYLNLHEEMYHSLYGVLFTLSITSPSAFLLCVP